MEKMEMFIQNYGVWVGLVILVVEYLMGKTKVIKAKSTIEAVLNVLLGILKMVFKPKVEEKPKDK